MEISLKAARINSELTQENVSNALHVSVQTIAKYEKDSSKIPMDLLERLSHLYQIPMNNIFLGLNTNKLVKVGEK